MSIFRKKSKITQSQQVSESNPTIFYHNFKIISRPDLPPEHERNDYFSNGMRRVRKLIDLINRWS